MGLGLCAGGEKIRRHQMRPLMQQLVERMLTVISQTALTESVRS